MKSALRAYLTVSYGLISILLIGSMRSPPPIQAAPDFPLCRGQNKTPRIILFISSSTVSIGCCAPACGGKVVAPSHQRGKCISSPAGRLSGFRRQRRHLYWRPQGRRTSPAQRYYIPPEGGALNPFGRRQPVPDRTLGAQGQRPGGAINPHARKGASTYGNTGKHRPCPGPDRAEGACPLTLPSEHAMFKLDSLKSRHFPEVSG